MFTGKQVLISTEKRATSRALVAPMNARPCCHLRLLYATLCFVFTLIILASFESLLIIMMTIQSHIWLLRAWPLQHSELWSTSNSRCQIFPPAVRTAVYYVIIKIGSPIPLSFPFLRIHFHVRERERFSWSVLICRTFKLFVEEDMQDFLASRLM